jgi:hypothetical protein
MHMMQKNDSSVNHGHTVPPFGINMPLPFLGYESCCVELGSSRCRERITGMGAAI